MVNFNDNLLFQNKINQRKIEKVQYIELEKYSRKVYRKELVTNIFIVLFLILIAGAVALCQFF